LTKQTTGLLVGFPFLIGTMLIVGKLRGLRSSGRSSLAMLLGAALPVAPTFLWLYQNGAWSSYVDQVAVRGPASKGGFTAALLRPLVTTIQSPELNDAIGLFVIASLAFALAWLYTAARARTSAGAPFPTHSYLLAAVLLVFATGLLATVRPYWDSRTFPLAAVYLGLIGSFALLVTTAAEWWRTGLSFPLAQKALLAGVSFAAAYAQSTSWAAWEPMALPALALVLAYLLDLPRRIDHAAWLRPATVIVCMGLIVVGTWRKTSGPATWGGWYEPPIMQSRFASARPELSGFRLSEGTRAFYDNVTDLIQRHSQYDDPILVFPYMPILYGLADRRPATFAFQHWTDVCPEYVANADMDHLLAHPPAVMVILELTDSYYAQQEQAYRHGQTSAQRRMLVELARMTRDYKLCGKFLAPGTNLPIKVWVRRDKVSCD
jgi:hypothetical protein